MSRIRVLERVLRRWMSDAIYELRRTRRVIVSPDARSACEAPIFILGVHRSGTTLLRLILDSHSGIACPPESFFIAQLEGVRRDEKAMEGLSAMGFDEAHVRSRLRALVSYFFETYAAARGKNRWADKTPSYIDSLDFIDSLFAPSSRYVLIFRHGLDVACSIAGMEIREVNQHIDACAGDRHAGAARYWSLQCRKLLDFRDSHAERCHELRYEELTRNPEATLRPMFEFLAESWEPEVLEFHTRSHDHWIGLQDSKAAEARGFEPKIDAWRAQPHETIERMLAEAGPMLDELGYSAGPEGKLTLP